eukprot:CAMPEP_0116898606 /NCGR_PEP_ID=MMETSP0467-20121206/7309_1 /TAXON_ID=283647 /ORGANISM="Mesodinium pulex, Strain SPMC105" /LENGTH=232 /DNA_ID=CAMNT_0004570863 /DNA_START=421 /DNA_END=1119 /DNA_ORIENTATION=+
MNDRRSLNNSMNHMDRSRTQSPVKFNKYNNQQDAFMFFRKQRVPVLDPYDQFRSKDHFVKAYMEDHFKNINFKIQNKASGKDKEGTLRPSDWGSINTKASDNSMFLITSTKSGVIYLTKLMMSGCAPDCILKTAIKPGSWRSTDFWKKLNSMEEERDNPQEYEIMYKELKQEFPNEYEAYLKADSWLKKTIEDNNVHSKFIIDDGEFDVELDWVDQCNTLIVDFDKGFVGEV